MARPATVPATASSSRNRGLLLIAALAGVLAAALTFAYLNSQSGGKEEAPAVVSSEETVAVVVVNQDVPFGTKITADMVEVRRVPVAMALTGAFSDAKDVVGKVATTPLIAGEQVVAAKVSDFAGQNTLSYRVPDGRRAMSVTIPHEAWAAAGLVQPGDYVDVLAVYTVVTVDPETTEERTETRAAIIAQDVPVLAVAQTLVEALPKVDEEGNVTEDIVGNYRPTGSQTFEEAISVTLGVTPEEAALIAMIDAARDDEAQFRLLVRQTGDHEPIVGPLNWADLAEAVSQ